MSGLGRLGHETDDMFGKIRVIFVVIETSFRSTVRAVRSV